MNIKQFIFVPFYYFYQRRKRKINIKSHLGKRNEMAVSIDNRRRIQETRQKAMCINIVIEFLFKFEFQNVLYVSQLVAPKTKRDKLQFNFFIKNKRMKFLSTSNAKPLFMYCCTTTTSYSYFLFCVIICAIIIIII